VWALKIVGLVGFVTLLVFCAVVHWRVWRRGADLPWSQRLSGLFGAAAGVVMAGAMVAVLALSPSDAVVWTVAVAALLAGGIGAAARVAALRERSALRRDRAALGLPAARRMWPVWAVGTVWAVAVLAVLVAVVSLYVAHVDGRAVATAVPVDQDAASATAVRLAVAFSAAAILGAAGLMVVQRRRRTAEFARVRLLDLAAASSPPTPES
jgi:hypothetical protein